MFLLSHIRHGADGDVVVAHCAKVGAFAAVDVYKRQTCTCAHKWKEATCTEPKTCVYCGMTEGEPLGHDWKAATINYPKTCVRCGKTEGEAYGIY